MEHSKSCFTIEKYQRMLQRRWLSGLIIFLSVSTLGLVVIYLQKPIYEAEAKLKFKKAELNPYLENIDSKIESSSSIRDSNILLNTEAEVIRSFPLLRQTLKELTTNNTQGQVAEIDTIRKKLQIYKVPQTNVLNIVYRDDDPVKATKFINTLIANYLDNDISINEQEAISLKKFITNQLPKTEATLQATSESIRKLKQENEIFDTQAENNLIIRTLRDLQQRIAYAQGQITNISSQTSYIKKKLGMSSEEALVATSISQSAEVQELIKELQELESQLAQVKNNSVEKTSEIIELNNEIVVQKQLLKEAIQGFAGNEVNKFVNNTQFNSIRQELALELIKLEANGIGLSKEITYLAEFEKVQKNKAQLIPQLEQQLQELETKLKVAQSNYQLLQEQLTRLQLATSYNTTNARVVSYAVVPDRPITRRSLVYLTLAGLSLLTSAIAIFLLETTDKSLHTIARAKKLFGYPWLGTIPEIEISQLPSSSRDPSIPRVIVRNYPSSYVSESYRILQSNLKFLSRENSSRSLKTIAITSCVAQEGKSTIAANLACAMGQVGHKILLVDANLHHPKQHLIWSIDGSMGLKENITEELDLKLTTQQVMSNLDVIASGKLPLTSATLIDSQKMRELISYWGQIYDFVIIDCPPLNLAADAAILGRMADGILLVVRPNAVKFPEAQFAKETLESSVNNVLGMVFNNISSRTESGRYFYHPLEKKQEISQETQLLSHSTEELWDTFSRLSEEFKKERSYAALDFKKSHNLGLKELKTIVADLQQDLDELTKLVSEQEDELFMHRQSLRKLQRKVNLANTLDRFTLEQQLEQEQEIKNMLDETLVGQRRNLHKRRQLLHQYQQMLQQKQN